ncbi:MAG TPA: NAD-dependent epimerase/dehydratase family protein [Chloroflexota bacterium]|nr:NAD-dependent epimerase/dehydratase family protein [Chloroflexota bacterium]
MRVLVTGGAGFIASHVAERFLQLGHDVIIVDNLSTGRRENVPAGARLVEMDIASPDVGALIREVRPEIVDHHAAHADVRQSVENPSQDAAVNVVGMIALMHEAARAGVRKFIFASSGGAIYGDPDVVPCDETHPVRPLSPYGASKAAGEVYLETFGRVLGMDFTILRYPNVYGPRQHPYTEEGQVVALFSRLMLEGRQPTIFGDGEQARDFVFVSDIAEANVLALDRGSRRTFNIGTGVALTVNALTDHLRRLTGYAGAPAYAAARPGEVYRIALDAARARDELGWRPTTALEDGLARTVDWVRASMTAGHRA